jgi:hypothetical protein
MIVIAQNCSDGVYATAQKLRNEQAQDGKILVTMCLASGRRRSMRCNDLEHFHLER